MPDWLFHIPLPAVGCIVITCICGFALAGVVLTRRFILPRMKVNADDSEFIGTMVQNVMVFYGLAMALVAVSVWETHSEVSASVSLEASRLGALYRDVGEYPEPLRSELRAELHGYADYLINEAWPQQKEGIHPTRGIEWMTRFQDSLFTFEPTTENDKVIQAEAFKEYNSMLEARHLRMDAMLISLPDTLWFVIVVGAVLSLTGTFFFKVADVRLHMIQVTLVSAFVGLVITLIIAFDRPFHGELGVGPESYGFIREQLMTD